MHIGILQTGHAPDALIESTGDFGVLFQKLLANQGLTFTVYSVVDMEFPDGPEAADGWLITGSKHGAYEDHPFIPPLEDLIRAIYAADRPLVGICFGHQIIAQALGGKVEKFDSGWAVGRQVYDWQGQPVTLNAWHQDQIVAKPDDATVCATNEFCEYAALIYGKKAFTVQAHPEFDSTFIDLLATHRGPGVVPDVQLAAVKDGLDKPNDNALLAARIGQFFRERSIA
ncbi:GMP synthase (glutamine-hydrolysing) [Cognatiyoonia koreensis]|uniref:GMP synthase (Glutamine-hydrolysing) n=1 Tax=Cognatiyoonia koreensis TaxID=364200 RepID=A0A1I0Q724_9RHOB|nr:type 1 glutamine amidotransferase [Cognatiyoonia koreensis]SEW22682.1 GMP synthase (glutamine-hydrolysing) [Cognatiyoonia koreensis]